MMYLLLAKYFRLELWREFYRDRQPNAKKCQKSDRDSFETGNLIVAVFTGLGRCGTVFPVSVVVGAAVPSNSVLLKAVPWPVLLLVVLCTYQSFVRLHCPHCCNTIAQ